MSADGNFIPIRITNFHVNGVNRDYLARTHIREEMVFYAQANVTRCVFSRRGETINISLQTKR